MSWFLTVVHRDGSGETQKQFSDEEPCDREREGEYRVGNAWAKKRLEQSKSLRERESKERMAIRITRLQKVKNKAERNRSSMYVLAVVEPFLYFL